MVRVTLSPEGFVSYRPPRTGIRAAFDAIITQLEQVELLRLPGQWPTHQLGGSRGPWTVRLGSFRRVYR